MQAIQVGHLKSDFSDVLQRVKDHGEMFVIEYGRSHKKVAMLIPYQASLEHNMPRVFGIMKNRASFTLQENFSITDEEFLGNA